MNWHCDIHLQEQIDKNKSEVPSFLVCWAGARSLSPCAESRNSGHLRCSWGWGVAQPLNTGHESCTCTSDLVPSNGIGPFIDSKMAFNKETEQAFPVLGTRISSLYTGETAHSSWESLGFFLPEFIFLHSMFIPPLTGIDILKLYNGKKRMFNEFCTKHNCQHSSSPVQNSSFLLEDTFTVCMCIAIFLSMPAKSNFELCKATNYFLKSKSKWLLTLYKFQMYSIITWHLCIPHFDQYPKWLLPTMLYEPTA